MGVDGAGSWEYFQEYSGNMCMYTCACTACTCYCVTLCGWIKTPPRLHVHVHVHVNIHVHVYLTNSAFYIIRPEI